MSTQEWPNKRGAGQGGFAVLWRAGCAWPALPDRERWAGHHRDGQLSGLSNGI